MNMTEHSVLAVLNRTKLWENIRVGEMGHGVKRLLFPPQSLKMSKVDS